MYKSFFLTALSISSRLISGVLLLVVLARVWGPESFGLFAFTLSVSLLLILIIDFGFSTYLLREVSFDITTLSKKITSVFWIKIYLIPLFFACSTLTFLTIQNGESLNLALPLCLAAIFVSFSEVFIAPMRALGRYDVEANVVISTNILYFVAPMLTIWLEGGVLAVCWTICICRLISVCVAAFGLMYIHSVNDWSPTPWNIAKKSMRTIIPYGIDGIIMQTFLYLDIVIVRAIYGLEIVGLYSAGQRIIQGVSSLSPVIGNVMIPRVAREAKSNKNLQRTALQTVIGMSGLGILLGLPIIIAPDWVSGLIFGSTFQALAPLLPLFGVLLIIRFVAGGFGILVTAVGLQVWRTLAQGIALFIFIAGSLAVYKMELEPRFIIGLLIASYGFILVLYVAIWLKFINQRSLMLKNFSSVY